MRPDQVARAADALAQARRDGVRFDYLPVACQIPDMPAGYAVQEALHEKLGIPIAGYKIGCTTTVMQEFLEINQPCGGSIQVTDVHKSPAMLPHNRFHRVGVECEIAVRLGHDLPPDEAPFTRVAVTGAVATCMSAIEIVDDRYVDYSSLDAATLIADDFFGAGCVLGPALTNWQTLDLAKISATMRVNEREVGRGKGAQVMGHPFEALIWLADTLAQVGQGLKKDQIVLTGSIVETQWVAQGDTITVTVNGLGTAKVSFT